MPTKLNLTLIIKLFVGYQSIFSQSKIEMAVAHETLGTDTFYFQKNQYNSLNLSFSDQVSSFFIGRNSGSMSFGNHNIGIGRSAMAKNLNGSGNLAIGFQALQENTSGSGQLALGNYALKNSTGGIYNIAIGTSAQEANNQGNQNVAIGAFSLAENTTGEDNVAIGYTSSWYSQEGNKNTAVGSGALRGQSGQSHSFNTAIGAEAARSITTGFGNTAVGTTALRDNTTGSDNVALGLLTMPFSISSRNVVVGSLALSNHTSGDNNVIIGYNSGRDNLSGAGNIFIGSNAGLLETGSNKLYIHNGPAINPLIFGEFAEERLVINGKELASGSAALEINDGNAKLLMDGNDIDADQNLKINGQSGTDVTFGKLNTEANYLMRGKVLELAHDNAPVLRLTRTNPGSGGFYDYEMYMNGADLRFRGGGNGTANLVDRVSFRANGNVGIGVPLPDNTLDVNGDVHIQAKTGSTDLLLLETDEGTDVLQITGGLNPQAQLFGYWDIASPEVGLEYPDNTEAIEVNSSFFMNSLGQIRVGNFGNGKTPMADIHVKQSFNSNNTSNYYPGIRLEENSGTDYWVVNIDALNDYNFYYNGTLKAYIRDDTGDYVISSDSRLKSNIQSLSPVLSQILQLNPSSYSYKSDINQQRTYGFLAQELQEIFPEMVSEKNGRLGVAYANLIPVAIKGIQELSEENENLKKEVALLRKEMAEIKALLEK